MADLEWMKSIRNRLKIPPSSFGFAGEVYSAPCVYEERYKKIVDQYIFVYQNICVNRKALYYSTSFDETCSILAASSGDYHEIRQSNMSFEYKRYVLFTITEYVMHSLCKLLDICFENKTFREKFYSSLKEYLEYYTDVLVQLLFSDDLPDFNPISAELLNEIKSTYILENIAPLREHVEMDHKMILILGYSLYANYIEQYDLLLCPLLGAAQVPVFFRSMKLLFAEHGCKAQKIQYDYVKYSTYDRTDILPLQEQLSYISGNFDRNTTVLLLDESLGTGATVLKIKKILKTYFYCVAAASIEFRWDKKIVWNKDREWFHIDDIDFITPLTYRHYLLLANQINSFKMNVVNRQPYIPFMIFEDINFEKYMSTQYVDVAKQNRMDLMFTMSKNLMDIFYS